MDTKEYRSSGEWKKHCLDALPEIHFGSKQPLSLKVFHYLVLAEDS